MTTKPLKGYTVDKDGKLKPANRKLSVSQHIAKSKSKKIKPIKTVR